MTTLPITNRSRLPRFRRVTEPPRMVLTARDRAILHHIHALRLLTREQVERLVFRPPPGQDHFTKTSKARLRLKLLYQHGYVDRIPLPVGAGTWAWQPVYRLSRKGAEVVAGDLKIDPNVLAYWGRKDDRSQRHTRVSQLFLRHALAINDLRITVLLACDEAGFRIEKWLDDTQLKSQEMRDYVTVSDRGGSRKVAVIPDAYFLLHLGDRRAHFFLELDRATMDHSRWATRVKAYLAYVRSGKYTERYQTRSLRILTVTTTEQRLFNLKETTHKAGGGEFFWFTTLDQVSPASVLYRPIWLLANDARGEESDARARKSLLG